MTVSDDLKLDLCFEGVLDRLKLEDPPAQRLSSAFSGICAFIPGNSTLIFLGCSGSSFTGIFPCSFSSLISSSAKIVIPDGRSCSSGSKYRKVRHKSRKANSKLNYSKLPKAPTIRITQIRRITILKTWTAEWAEENLSDVLNSRTGIESSLLSW